ncbi:MAG: LacI family DNA-binding transcriptional regulator [Opitutaceae bacterium]
MHTFRKVPRAFTITDVARLAGVSVASASAVLNNKGTTSLPMTQRVKDAMKRLDYRPDNTARSLKTGKSKVIGMVVPDVTNPFYTEIMEGLEAMARSHGYSVILSNSHEDPMIELENLDMLRAQRVDGVVLGCSSDHVIDDRLIRQRFPIVFIDRLPTLGNYPGRAVLVDNLGAAFTATQHLISLGHSKIAVIAGRTDLSVGLERANGYRKAMQEANLPVPDSYFCAGDFLADSGHRCGLRLLQLPEPPTAIFSCNNSMTLGLMRALSESGVRCPDQMSVVTFDDFPWASYFQPQMTAVAQPTREIGRQALRMLFSILKPDSAEAREIKEPMIILQAELRVRKSTAPHRI